MTKRTWIVGLVAAALGAYAYALWRVVHGLRKLKPGTNDWRHTMSVVVPARNEARWIRRCLEALLAQDYPRYLYEVIVVNDRSSDATARMVKEVQARSPHVRLVNVDKVPAGIAPKKHAVTVGIGNALGQIVVTTDADCVPGKGWLAGINREFAPDVGVVVGHTAYRSPRNWFEGIQSLDYLSHRIIGAGTVGTGEVITSTASNLAYRKRVFEEVGGFGESSGLVSGDDDLFLHRVHTKTAWRVVAATAAETFVCTEPAASWGQFIRQRARWASKVPRYHRGVMPFLVVTFLLLGLIVVTLPFAIAKPRRWLGLWALLAAKAGVDYWVMKQGAITFRQADLMKYFWGAEVMHPFYTVVAVVWGLIGRFTWKGEASGRSVAGASPDRRADARDD